MIKIKKQKLVVFFCEKSKGNKNYSLQEGKCFFLLSFELKAGT